MADTKIKRCKQCGDKDEDMCGDLCMLCFEFENNPKTFGLTEEQAEDQKRCADYIFKNGIKSNIPNEL